MKPHSPITAIETPFPQGRYLVSKTDLKGIIVDANDAFVDISGFSRNELIGQSHNIVRHPDMPPQAFADLWRTVKKGRPWQGLVKNRCKNGTFYWVRAFVVPIRKNGQVTGYMSVRSQPSREQVQLAEDQYNAMRHSNAPIAQPRTWLSIRQKMLGMTLLSALSILAGGFIGASSLEHQHPNLFIAGLAGCAGIISLGWWSVAAGILNSLNAAVEKLGRIAEGRLADEIDISRQDEIGNLFTSMAIMQTTLRIMLDDILQAARDIDGRSKLLEANMAQVTSHSGIQQRHTDLVAGNLKEVTHSANLVADSAAQAAQAAASTQDVIHDSKTRMDETMHASEMVVAAVQQSSNTMMELFQSIFHVGEITQLIKEIAEQTNLLALNAAIEAARAGEAGRGFAVVADEVRKLAERTATSTLDINQTVQAIQSGTQNAVFSMEHAVSEVAKSTALMHTASDGLQQISQKSCVVTDMAQQIASAAHQQSGATGSVSSGMDQISQLIAENTQVAESASQAVVQLSATSLRLRSLIGEFELLKA